VQRFITIAPRQSYRVALNIAVDGKFKDLPFLCHTENISSTGMLIRTALDLAPGDRISCSFYLPQGAKVIVQGELARTVIQTAGSKESFYGVRYTDISMETKTLIEAYVANELGYHPLAPDLRARLAI
jgi:c-di-GMP-binding flagellar brake protein YcgR